MVDFTPIEETPFRVPDHTASVGPFERVKERIGVSASDRKKPTMSAPRKQRATEPPSSPGEFVEPIADFYRFAAMAAMPFDPVCSMVILETESREGAKNFGKDRAQICAEALDDAAQKSPQLRKFLRMATTGGVWGAVIAAHAPIIFAVVSHHTPLMERVTAFQAERMAKMAGQSDEDNV